MKRMLKFLAAVVLALGVIMPVPRMVRADVAPPEAPPGSTLLPGSETTQVRMLAETVTLEVSVDPANAQGAVAKTTAQFSMRNLGSETEPLQVRFPLRFMMWPDERYPEIADLKVMVDGKRVPTQNIIMNYHEVRDLWSQDVEIPWSVFDVSFPPSQDVGIEVSYSVHGFGYYPYQAFRYILQTGAGWKDSIGSADIIVKLPFAANQYNVWVDAETGFSTTTPGGQFSGNEIHWHFENLEPTFKDNFEISLIAPSLWQKVLAEKANITRDPKDGEAWGRLAKAYKEITRGPKGYPRTDAAAMELFGLSKEAYEKCLSLLPGDSLWHTGYADLLWTYYYFQIHMIGEQDAGGMLPGALSHLQTALDLNPNNQLARDLLDEISYTLPEAVVKNDSGYDLLGLTATPVPPTPFVMDTETAAAVMVTPQAVVTVEQPTQPPPASSPQPTEIPAKSKPLPLCGGAVLLPLIGAGLWLGRRRAFL